MTIEIPFSLAVSAASEVETELVSPGSILFNLLVILSLVFLNGFFVASEFALVKVRSSQLDALDEKDKRVALARHVSSHLDAYLSATQLGITLSTLALGCIPEHYVALVIQPVLFHDCISVVAIS